MKADIDAVVPGDAVPAEVLLGQLARYGIEPRIEDAVAFAHRGHRPRRLGWLAHRLAPW